MMTEILANVSIASLGATGLLTVTVLMVLTGRLVSRTSLLDSREDAKRWHAAYVESEKVIDELIRQNTALIISAKVGAKALESIPRVHQGLEGGGDG